MTKITIKSQRSLEKIITKANKLELQQIELELLQSHLRSDYRGFIRPYREEMSRLALQLDRLEDFPSPEMVELLCDLLRKLFRGRRVQVLPEPIQRTVHDMFRDASRGLASKIRSENSDFWPVKWMRS
jgi:hypothetical protein